MHNHARQSLLALEKHWVTLTGYFRIITTIVGICITDAWKAYRYHLNRQHRHKDIEMKDFASALAYDMLHNDFDSLTSVDRVLVLDSGRGEMQSQMSSLGGVTEVGRCSSGDNGCAIDTHGLYSRSERGIDNSGDQRKRDCKTWRVRGYAGNREESLCSSRDAEALLNLFQ